MQATKTPIQAWPPPKFHGRPGYSARHFRSVSPPADDPLRVAERIAAERVRECLMAADFSMDERHEQLDLCRQEVWRLLCVSFDNVIACLESVPQTPAMKALVKQAKRAAKDSARRTS